MLNIVNTSQNLLLFNQKRIANKIMIEMKVI